MSEQTPEPEPAPSAPSEGEQMLEALPDNQPDRIFGGNERVLLGTIYRQESGPSDTASQNE